MVARRHSSNAHGVSFFQGASNINMSGGTIVGTQNYNITVVDRGGGPLSLLYNKVAHNAILNAGGRADEVRCHPGTREEVLSKTKRWRDHGPEHMFWLSGPAGAGKSAIIQTFAENYITSALIMINFFFFRSDPTRNHLAPIVATLIFQLLELYPDAKRHISDVLAEMPYIFDKSIRDQFLHLIINPISYLRNLHNDSRPVVLLIDGLDECDTGKSQATLVRILDDLVSMMGSPFKVLVSSRKEAHLTMAFNQIRETVGFIFLDDEYQPEQDIRRYVTDQLAAIKRTHHLGHTLQCDWPSSNDIEYIVRKSSGQFIYAATVVRFLSSSSPSPAHSLDEIVGINQAQRNSPFAALDAVYTHILAHEDDWDNLKVILSAQIILNAENAYPWLTARKHSLISLIKPMGYTENHITTHTANLGALMICYGHYITFYHASLVDFLTDPTRSGDHFLDIPIFTAHLATIHISNIVHNHDYTGLHVTFVIVSLVTVSSPALEDALAALSPHDDQFMYDSDVCCIFLRMFNKMYSESNERLYRALLRKWLLFAHRSNYTSKRLELGNIKLGLETWADIEQYSSKKRRDKVGRFMKQLFQKS